MWKVFPTGSAFPLISDFKLTYEGREIITFPVKNTDNLISLVTPLSVLIFTKFMVIKIICTYIHHWTSYFIENFLTQERLQCCFLICAMMWNDKLSFIVHVLILCFLIWFFFLTVVFRYISLKSLYTLSQSCSRLDDRVLSLMLL